METLGDKIYKLRVQANLSQEELGHRIGVSRQAVSLWETNAFTPKLSNIIALCEVFGVSEDYLLRDDNLPAINSETVVNKTKVTSAQVKCETVRPIPKLPKRHNKFLHAMIWVVIIYLGMLSVWIYNIVIFSGDKKVDNMIRQVYYTVDIYKNGGTLQGEMRQTLKVGEDGEKIIAVPYDGYYFVQWSDGITTPIRQDKNVQQNISVKAEFAKITNGINIKYDTKGPGYIRGKTTQFIQSGTDSFEVEAGTYYDDTVFISWSDGVKTPTRQEKSITEDISVTALFGYNVSYNVSGRGGISGRPQQAVVGGEDASEVTAVPEKGYTFVGWSDGVMSPTRQDLSVTRAIDVTATFEWHNSDDFTYNYNYATSNNTIKSINLARGSVDKAKFVVPQRKHFKFLGWYLDEQFTKQASNSYGEPVIGKEIFDTPSRDLYAKWQAISEDVVTYKLLMIYVTEIDAALIGHDGRLVYLHYTMSDEERMICEEISSRYADDLNDKMDGLVNFEVDSYFTVRPIGHESISIDGGTYYISPENIPELSGMVLDNYRKVIVTISFGGEDNVSPRIDGRIISDKYINVYLERLFYDSGEYGQYQIASRPDFIWQYTMDNYNRLFIKSITEEFFAYDYSSAKEFYLPSKSGHYYGYCEFDKLYLLNQCVVANGRKVGIPYGYWRREYYNIKFETVVDNFANETGGYIVYGYTNLNDFMYNGVILRVPKEASVLEVGAIPYDGYKFVNWSDGVEKSARVLTDIESDVHLIAYFEKYSDTPDIMVTVTYVAAAGGHISGEAVQTLLFGETTSTVLAVPEEGYRFVGWHDGNKSPGRKDKITSYDNAVYIALFEKME